MEPLLELAGLTAGYDGKAVVSGIDLTVGPGEIVALLGPNGAGKSTTLKAISGSIRALDGSVRFEGQDLGRQPTHRRVNRGLVHVPERAGLVANLTVRANLRLMRGGGRNSVTEIFPELERLSNRRAGLLSGGEQRMLALARVLSVDPKVMLIDELSLGLAPIIVSRMLPLLRSTVDERGIGVLLVEQHVKQALDVADRAYVMTQGRIALEGSAEELRERRDLLEASYMGIEAVS